MKGTVISYLLATIVCYFPKQIILNHIVRLMTMCNELFSLISDSKFVNYGLHRYASHPSVKLTKSSGSLKTQCTNFAKSSSTTLSCLPDEIISHIFARVPADQLTPMKGVCKQWNSLISHPDFVKFQLIRSRLSQLQILILADYTPDDKLLSINMQDKEDLRFENLYLNFPFHGKYSVKASCDGLLVLDQEKELYVYNPATTKWLRLPNLDTRVEYWTLFYDNDMGKYRIFVTITVNKCEYAVLTVGEDNWRWLQARCEHALTPAIYVKNKLHWVLRRFYDCGDGEKCCIRSIDVAKMEYKDTTIPSKGDGYNYFLSEVKGYLCLTTISRDELELDIFVLDSASHGKWTNKYSVNIQSLANLPVFVTSFLHHKIFLAAMRDVGGDDFSDLMKMFIWDRDQLIYYDLKCQESREIGPLTKIQFCLDYSHSCLFYSASLVEV